MSRYFKITNRKEIHHDFPYKDGLNILDKPFETEGSCVEGGLYFTMIEYLHQYYEYGIYIREIFLPETDPDFQMVRDPNGDKWRANKIILGNRYSLLDPETYNIFGLDIERNSPVVDIASKYGSILLLEWYKKNKSTTKLKHTSMSMDDASGKGHVDVLQWWLDSELKLKFTNDALINAAEKGRIDVLNWWKKYFPEFVKKFMKEYNSSPDDYDILKKISQKGFLDVLNWLKVEKFQLKSAGDFMTVTAAEYNQIKLLDWLKENLLLPNKFTYAINMAIRSGHVEVLEWFKKLGPIKYSSGLIDIACENGHVHVLEWLKNNSNKNPFYLCSSEAMDIASKNGHIEVLEWLKNNSGEISGSKLKYTDAAMTLATDIKVLDWWLNSGLECKCESKSNLFNYSYEIIKWWLECGLEIVIDKHSIKLLFKSDNDNIYSIINLLINSNHKLTEPTYKKIAQWALENDNFVVLKWWIDHNINTTN